jgi:hypothetical protein
MEAADAGKRSHPCACRRFRRHPTADWCVFVQSEVASIIVIVNYVIGKETVQVSLVQDDDVVQTRSRIRYLCALSSGNASLMCYTIHRAYGSTVTAK